MDRRGLLDAIPREVAGLAGLGLALAGVLYLIHIWWTDRFQVSIGRLMLVVALIAVLLQGVLLYREWIKRSLPCRPALLRPPKNDCTAEVDRVAVGNRATACASNQDLLQNSGEWATRP